MKIADRYVLREFLKIFLLSIVTLMVFYEMVVFLDMVGYFVKFGATTDMVARYMLFKLPMGVFHVTPICVLLASILTMGSMSRYSEITALRAAGMSLARISAPVIAASFVIAMLAFLDSEKLFHLSARESNRIYYEEIKRQPRKGLFTNERIWYKAGDGSIWNIGHLDTAKREIRDISIFRFDPQGTRLASRLSAPFGKAGADGWALAGCVERTFSAGGAFEEAIRDKCVLSGDIITEEDLKTAQLDPEEMNLEQMRSYIRDIKTKGYDHTRYTADMHAKIAFPLINIVMPLIAIPLGVRSSRRGGAMIGVGVAVVTGAVFWFMFSMGVAFGQAGKITPWISVYAAHVLFTAAGIKMFAASERN
jgi:lipopolysaccharide export system permease protein